MSASADLAARAARAERPTPAASHRLDLAILASVSLVLALAAHLAAGPLSLGMLGARRLVLVTFFPLLFAISTLLVVVVASLVRMRRFVDPSTRRLDVPALLRSVWVNPLPGAAMALATGYGITGCGNLVEIYRARTTVFHDAALWRIEGALFERLLASPLNVPMLWDRIYFSFWAFLFTAMAYLYWEGQRDAVVRFMLAAVLSFYLMRVIVLFVPTAGPVFFHPEFFRLDGTLSAGAQAVLRLYMRGAVPQNGILPGTTAMPSLHVGLLALGIGLLGREHPATLRWALPWLCATWAATVFLGWHYVLDGAGGIALAGAALMLAIGLLRVGHALSRTLTARQANGGAAA